MSDKVYSYHTFLFPFIWKTDKNVSKEDFLKVLSIKSDSNNAEGRWKLYNWDKRIEDEKFLSDYWMNDYQAYQYFTDSANNLLFHSDRDSNAVDCYYYPQKYKSTDEKGNNTYHVKYVITKNGKVYRLNINNIRLNVYDAGIAILILETENCENTSLDAVNAINEYGRRINFPFLVPGSTPSLCADSIEIQFQSDTDNQGENNPFKEDFLYTSKQIQATKFPGSVSDAVPFDKNDDISFTYIMQPIQALLDGGKKEGIEITANPNHKNETGKFYIKPCIDDRMFVCCIVMDDALSREIQGIESNEICYYQNSDLRLKKTSCTFSEKDGEYHVVSSTGKEYNLSKEEFKYKVDKDNKYIVVDSNGELHGTYMEGWADETALSNRIYKFMYIENDLSCQEPNMKKQILSGSVYSRWANGGTIYGITHHSLCGITNTSFGANLSVVLPFLIEYVQMAVLAVVQRAVILMLEDEVAKVSNKFSENYTISEQDIAEIERLQAKYVKVQNQMLLSEVTVQEQGVEMYEMFRKQLYIEKNMKYLDSAMNNLRDVADNTNARLERLSDAKEDRKLNLLSYALAFLFIVEPLSIIIGDNWNFFAKNGDFRSETWWFGIPFVLGVGSALVLLIKWIISKCKK